MALLIQQNRPHAGPMPSCPEVHTERLRNCALHSLAMALAPVDSRAAAAVRP